MVLIQSTVGLPTSAANAATPSLRGEPTGGLVDQPAHLKYVEPCRVGALYSASTVNTGVTIASLTLTTTAPTSLANPTGSGVNIFLKSLTMGYVSGTLGTGQFFLVAHPNATLPTGTAATYLNSTMVGNTTIAKGLVLYTATVAASGKVLRNLWISTPILATSVFVPTDLTEDFDGQIGVMPGSSVSLQGITAAGSSPLAVFTWVWEEVTIAT